MLLVDIIILILLLGSAINGWKSGLIKTLAGLVGIIVGVVIASNTFPVLAEWLTPIFRGRVNLANIVSFFTIFLIINGLIGVGAYLLDKTFKIFSIIPFVKTINRIGGLILGVIGSVMVLGVVIVLLENFPFADFVIRWLDGSEIVPWILFITNMVLPLFLDIGIKTKEAVGK